MATAGVNVWTTNGPYAGNFTAVAVAPATAGDPGSIYAATIYEGVFKRPNGGDGWSPVGTGLPPDAVETLVIDSTTSPFAIYAGTRRGVFRIIEGDSSWTPVFVQPAGTAVTTLAIDETATPATVYVGTSPFNSSAGGGVFKSTDRGVHWSENLAPIVGFLTEVSAIAIDQTTERGTVFASVYRSASLGERIGGVFKTTDGGSMWSPINTNLEGLSVSTLIVDTNAQPAIVYASASGVGNVASRVFKSVDAGANWVETAFTRPGGLVLAVDDTASPTIVYAGTRSSGVFQTTDGGTIWSPVNSALSNLEVRTLGVDSNVRPAIVYAGTTGGLFESVDSGSHWSAVGPAIGGTCLTSDALVIDDRTTPATVYAGKYPGVFKSSDGGATWSNVIANLYVNAMAFDKMAEPAIVYAGTNNGSVFRTVDGGRVWTPSNLAPTYVGALAIDDMADPHVLYMGIYTATSPEVAGVRKTTDRGDSWLSTSLSTAVYSLAVDTKTNPASVYAAVPGDVLKTSDNGATWNTTHLPNDAGAKGELAIDFNTRPLATVYLGTGLRGVLKTADGGDSWMPTALDAVEAYWLAIDSSTTPSTVYAGSCRGAVYQSTDGGAHWTDVTRNLSSAGGIYALAIDPKTSPATVLADTPSGVYGIQLIENITPTATDTPAVEPTPTGTPMAKPTPTLTRPPTNTATPSPSASPTPSATSTESQTAAPTRTPTLTPRAGFAVTRTKVTVTPNTVVAADFGSVGVSAGIAGGALSTATDLVYGGRDEPVLVLLGNDGDGTFKVADSRAIPGTSGGLADLAVADLNGDRLIDVVATHASAGVVAALGTGKLGFGAMLVTTVSGRPGRVVVRDVTGDGKPDVLTVIDTGVALLRGHGDGTFSAPIGTAITERPTDLVIADVTGDGVLDLIVALSDANAVQILGGERSGGFQPRQRLNAAQPVALVVGQFTADAYPDVAVANARDLTVSLFPGTATGVSADPVLTVGVVAKHLLAADMDGDRALDLLALDAMQIHVLRGLNDGRFTIDAPIDASASIGAIAVADLNGDHTPDIVLTVPTADEILIATNTAVPPPLDCVGDCDRNGRVTADEVVRGLQMALGALPFESCSAFETNVDRETSIDELVAGIANALNGCP